MKDQHLEYDIQALVDNELEWEDRNRLLHYLNCHPAARERYEALLHQKEQLQAWWGEGVRES